MHREDLCDIRAISADAHTWESLQGMVTMTACTGKLHGKGTMAAGAHTAVQAWMTPGTGRARTAQGPELQWGPALPSARTPCTAAASTDAGAHRMWLSPWLRPTGQTHLLVFAEVAIQLVEVGGTLGVGKEDG